MSEFVTTSCKKQNKYPKSNLCLSLRMNAIPLSNQAINQMEQPVSPIIRDQPIGLFSSSTRPAKGGGDFMEGKRAIAQGPTLHKVFIKVKKAPTK